MANVKSKEYVSVGVAIVCWNNEKILPQCLDSIRAQTHSNIKTIVLDNNSSDNSVEIIERDYPWTDLIKSPLNTGFARGNNLIIEEFLKDESIKYIALVNSDAILDKDWVRKLVDFASEKPSDNIAFLQGLTLDFYDHSFVDSTHVYINQSGNAIQANYREKANNIGKMGHEVFGVNAAACIVSRDFLEKQPFDSLFDEEFFMYLEDVDICARATIMGWSSYFVPEAKAYHMGSASSLKNPGFSVYFVNRNNLPMLVKNLPLSLVFRMLPFMIFSDIKQLIRILRGRNYVVFRKFIWGRAVSIFFTLKFINKARIMARNRKIPTKSLWQLMKKGYV